MLPELWTRLSVTFGEPCELRGCTFLAGVVLVAVDGQTRLVVSKDSAVTHRMLTEAYDWYLGAGPAYRPVSHPILRLLDRITPVRKGSSPP